MHFRITIRLSEPPITPASVISCLNVFIATAGLKACATFLSG